MFEYMWAIWLGVFVIALIVEGVTTSVVSIWFALAAIVSLIVSFIPNVAWWVQLIIFLVISVATLFALRPVVSKYMKTNKVDTNVDEMVGKKGKMVKRYDELSHGEVKINDVIWTAINTNENEPIEEGEIVTVKSIIGNKVIVQVIKGGKQ
ncbi:MAG: NfeD family protein [Bacillales bacterium]|nr:NfeD family protein [Bacillales bacterium]MDY6003694.1 NfeD family protein [Bacilli bacterium]